MGRVSELVERLDRRKAAIVGMDDEQPNRMVVGGTFESILMLFAGADVDPDELRENASAAATMAIAALLAGHDPEVTLMSLWADGLATGLQEDSGAA